MFKFFIIICLFSLSLFSNDLKKVSLQLSWLNQFQFAGYYMAKEKGFYKEKNLDVEIKDFNFNVNVPKSVSIGESDFGIGRETLILEKINNHNNIVALYSLFQVSPLVLLTKENSNINSVKDFENKKLMATIEDSNEVSLKAMISSNNVDLKNIKFLEHTHNLDDLINDKADIISAYSSKSPFELEEQKIPYKVFAPKDYGFDMYSDFLFTSEKFIKNDIATVKDFKEASLKGWEYAYENIEETVDLILEKYNSQNITREALLYEANELKKLSYYNNNSLGNIDNNKLMRIFDLYNVMGIVNSSKEHSLRNFVFNESNYFFEQKEKEYLENDTIKMCVKSDSLPYESVNGEFTGIVAEYKKFFEKKLNTKISVISTNDKTESLEFLENNKCDIISLVEESKNVSQKNIKISKAYLNLPLVLVTKEHESFITSFEQLKGKKVYVNDEGNLSNDLKTKYPHLDLVKTLNFQFAFEQILAGNAFGYIGNITEVSYLLENIYANKLSVTGKFDEKMSFGFGLKKDNFTLENILNKVISNISDNEHKQLLKDYVVLKYKELVDYTIVYVTLLITTFIILSLIIFNIREKSLKRRIEKLNLELEEKVFDEVNKNRKKDEILFRQSKLASMGEMINNIAHQWRQPLNRIGLSTQVIDSLVKTEKFSDAELIEKKISHINKNIDYMSNTIEGFINYFHPDKKKSLFNLKKLVDNAFGLVKSRANDITFNFYVDEKLDILGFENELLQVTLVILENAIDNFANTNMKEKTIEIYSSLYDDKIVLIINDNGGGIPSAIINKIFDPYFSTKFEKEGIGLGLYMAKMIVEKSMGGKIHVFSNNGFTEFTITLSKDSNE